MRPQIAGEAAQRVGPVAAAVAGLDLGGEAVGEALEQRRAVGDVAVERHRLDAQLAGDAAHRQRVGALAVEQRQGGRQDRLARELGGPSASAGGERHAAFCSARAGFVHVRDLSAGGSVRSCTP